MIETVLFDWSGTLSDDFRPVYEANMRVFDELKVPRISIEEFGREFVLPYMLFFRKYTDAPQQTIFRIYSKSLHEVTQPTIILGAKEALTLLRLKGITLGLLSSVPEEKLLQEIGSYGLTDYFSIIRGSVLDKREAIKEIITKNDLMPSKVAFAGDMVHDIDTGKSAGVTSIAVTWGYSSKEKLSNAKPDYIVGTFDQLVRVILDKGG